MAFGKRAAQTAVPVRGVMTGGPADLALTPQRMRAMADAATAEMDALVAKVNAHIPGDPVLPWAIIPWAVWKDQNAVFLMQTDFLPSSPWNTLLLAADAPSSQCLGLPVHPRAAMPKLDEDISRLVGELRIASQGELHSGTARHEKLKNERFQKLFALMRYTATAVFGDEVLARHDELFGIGLKSVTG